MPIKLTPAIRELLVHCLECGGSWLRDDPVRVLLATVEAAERRGVVKIERLPNGTIENCSITELGRTEFPWHDPPLG